MTRVFYDTNVLINAFDVASPEKRSRARSEIYERDNDDVRIISTQVLQEFFAATTRRMSIRLSPLEAEAAVREFTGLVTVQIDTNLILRAIERSQTNQFSIWDSLIIEAALHANVDTLLSEDMQHGQVIDEMRIENPFRDL